MGYNKFIVGSEVKLDLSKDSVVENKLLKGITAHNSEGEPIVGECTFDADTSDATMTASTLLENETGYAGGKKLTGLMPNVGEFIGTITDKNTPITIPYGCHDGSGKVGLSQEDIDEIIPENIREGIDFLGVMGKMSGTEGVKAENKEVTPTLSDQILTPDADSGFNYIAKVTVKAIPIVESPTPGGGTTLSIG